MDGNFHLYVVIIVIANLQHISPFWIGVMRELAALAITHLIDVLSLAFVIGEINDLKIAFLFSFFFGQTRDDIKQSSRIIYF